MYVCLIYFLRFCYRLPVDAKNPADIDYDPLENILFWIEMGDNLIYRSEIDGTAKQRIHQESTCEQVFFTLHNKYNNIDHSPS